jgi:hypothetical protein
LPFLQYIPTSGIGGPYGISIFNFLRHPLNGCTNLHSYQQGAGFPFLQALPRTTSYLFCGHHPPRCVANVIMVLTRGFLMINGVEPFLIHASHSCLHWENVYLQSLPVFKFDLLLLQLSYMSSLHI